MNPRTHGFDYQDADDMARYLEKHEAHAQSCSGEAILQPTNLAVAQIVRGARRPPGVTGLASVQIHVEDAAPIVNYALVSPNMRVMLQVTWRAGRGGGSAFVDGGPLGSTFTVGAAEQIEVRAQIMVAKLAAFVAGSAQRVSASIAFGGSISPRPARCTMPAQHLNDVLGQTSTHFPIPAMASEVAIQTTQPTTAPGMQMVQTSGATGAELAIATELNPTGGWIALNPGARFVQVIGAAGSDQFVIPIFQLWL